jgi:hypothetical protein
MIVSLEYVYIPYEMSWYNLIETDVNNVFLSQNKPYNGPFCLFITLNGTFQKTALCGYTFDLEIKGMFIFVYFYTQRLMGTQTDVRREYQLLFKLFS